MLYAYLCRCGAFSLGDAVTVTGRKVLINKTRNERKLMVVSYSFHHFCNQALGRGGSARSCRTVRQYRDERLSRRGSGWARRGKLGPEAECRKIKGSRRECERGRGSDYLGVDWLGERGDWGMKGHGERGDWAWADCGSTGKGNLLPVCRVMTPRCQQYHYFFLILAPR